MEVEELDIKGLLSDIKGAACVKAAAWLHMALAGGREKQQQLGQVDRLEAVVLLQRVGGGRSGGSFGRRGRMWRWLQLAGEKQWCSFGWRPGRNCGGFGWWADGKQHTA